MAKLNNFKSAAVSAGYRSGLEEKVGNLLEEHGCAALYEPFKIVYTIPASTHTYTPDYELPNGIIIETKGRFVMEDRKKHLLVKKQHPDLDIRFVFANAKAKLRKGSPTTYATWCEKNGFLYASKEVPEEWMNERANRKSINATKSLTRNLKK
jgi:hypothetical protein